MRVLVPVAKIIHLSWMRIILYLDDWLVQARMEEEMSYVKKFILNLVHEMGIVINYEKSNLEAT